MLQGLKLFRIWRFEFVSDFEIRISDFPVAAIAALDSSPAPFARLAQECCDALARRYAASLSCFGKALQRT
jgi:hypothetical protein